METKEFEGKIERQKFEKTAVFIRHPSTRIYDLLGKGTEETPWDDLEDKVFIERGAGHDMSSVVAEHLVKELPELVQEKEGQRTYKMLSSPLIRARALAKYVLLHIREEKKKNEELSLPDGNDIEVVDNFSEIPMTYSKGEILDILKKIKAEGRSGLAAMEEWFKSNPEFIASIFEKERERVLEGLEKIKNGSSDASLIFTHRLLTGFVLWLIENQDENNPITPEDLPEIMDLARKIPYVSETEIGWANGRWTVLRKADVSYLDTSLVSGTF